MSGAIAAAVSGGGFDSTPTVTYLGSVFIGNLAANTIFSHTLNIGQPQPNRRVIAFNNNDYFSTSPNNPILSQKCRFAGIQAVRTGNLPEGFLVDTQFSVYIGRFSVWTSQKLTSGTTINVQFECTARTYWCEVGFVRIDNLLDGLKSTSRVTQSTITANNLLPGEVAVLQSRGEGVGQSNSATQITNTQFLFRQGSGRPSQSNAPFSAFLYQNTTRTTKNLTFNADQGFLDISRWR